MGDKIKRVGLLRMVVPTVTLILGFFMGNLVYNKKDHNAHFTPPADTPALSTFSHVNPLTSCVDYQGKVINMRELRWFRSELDKYIEKVHAGNPNIHISYYFRDLTNGMWIGINEKDEFSPASLLKLPIMIATFKEAEKNPSLLSVKIQYNKRDFAGVAEESGFEKKDGEYYSIDELINQMVDYSDNAAALLIMTYIGENKVSEVEKSLNLSIPNGASTTTNFVRIKDYASLFRVLFNSSYLSREMSEKALSLLSHSTYAGGIRAGVPDSIVVAHKYGVRDMHDASGNLQIGYQLHHFGIVYYPGKPFLIGIMSRGGTKEEKEKIVKDLSALTYRQVDKQLKSAETNIAIEKH